ncbi:MAG: hypothetical protein AAGI37_18220 [Planctomycetota bacterium]
MPIQQFNSTGTLSASGSTDWHQHLGGRVSVLWQGDFGGGTAVLQARFDSSATAGTATDIVTGNTLSVASGTADIPYVGSIEIPPCDIRVNLSGATSPDLNWQIGHTGGDRVTG